MTTHTQSATTHGYSALLYGLFVVMGGIMGYVQAGSTASLVMGLIFGILLVASAMAILQGKEWGIYTALVLAAVLALFFGYRFLGSFAFMPAGLMLTLSILVVVVLGLTLLQKKM